MKEDIEPSENSENPTISEEELNELRGEMNRFTDEHRPLRLKRMNYNIIEGTLSEFLNSYVILGYDIEDDDFIIMNAPKLKDKRALYLLVKEFIEGNVKMINSETFDDYDDEEDYDEDE